jgi:hypothetical protein
MSLVLIDAYKGENPAAFNNPPVNEVLLIAANTQEGTPYYLKRDDVFVQLLQPTQLFFFVNSVESDGYVWRVKLAVFGDTPVPTGLNLGWVEVLPGGGSWGAAMCSVNLTDEIPRLTIPDPGVDPGEFFSLMRARFSRRSKSPVGMTRGKH